MEEPVKIAGVEQRHVEKKPKRKRQKKLCSQIREQMDFYFGDSNLHKDRFIKQKINESPDGYIDLQIFAKFNRLRQLTTDMGLVAKALSTSTLLQVSDDGKKVRRTKPIEEPKDIDDRTVYVEYIPATADHDWVRRVFTPFGNMSYISLPRYRSTGDMKGFAFVEFETADGAAKACEAYNNEAISSCRPGRFPRANKQMKLLMRQVEAKRSEVSRQTPGETEVTPSGKKKRCKRTSSDLSSIGHDSVSEANGASVGSKPCKRSHTCSENSGEDIEVPVKKAAVSVDEKPDANSSPKGKKTVEPSDADDSGSSRQRENTTEMAVTVKPGQADVDSVSSGKRKEKTTEVKEENKVQLAGGDNRVSRELLPEPGTGGLKRKASGVDAGEAKKVRISEDVQVHSAAGQLTKQRRRRQKVKSTTKELPELRVIPKAEWLQLRKEYLELQQRNMHELKETLQQLRAEEHRHIELSAERATKSKVEYVPGVILKVTSKEAMSRKQLKAHVNGAAEVAYIDLADGDTEGHIRCHDSDNSQKIVTLTNDQLNFSLLTGEEEENYWNKLAADREKKLGSKSKHKKRGRNKVSEKAEKASKTPEKKHTFFDDDNDNGDD